jgi:hypothetical protein
MFTHDQPHREWEMTPGTQRNFTIGFVVVAGLVVLMNLLPGHRSQYLGSAAANRSRSSH